jgi:hypothetical protein
VCNFLGTVLNSQRDDSVVLCRPHNGTNNSKKLRWLYFLFPCNTASNFDKSTHFIIATSFIASYFSNLNMQFGFHMQFSISGNCQFHIDVHQFYIDTTSFSNHFGIVIHSRFAWSILGLCSSEASLGLSSGDLTT